MQGDDIFVNLHPLAEGTYVQPLVIDAAQNANSEKKHFFVGWNPVNHYTIYRFALRTGIWLGLGLLITGFFVSKSQRKLGPFAIDYDHVKEIRGWLMSKPMPILRMLDGKDSDGNPLFRNILLVDGFKHGADASVLKFLGKDSIRYVKLRGYVSRKYISCGKKDEPAGAMPSLQGIAGSPEFPLMELENGMYSFEPEKEPFTYFPEKLVDVGSSTINGEILDAKCYLGAMNPGFGKTHMSCAIRCISGGIMPMIVYRLNGKENFALLEGERGEFINNRILPYVGRKLSISGHIMSYGNWQIVHLKDISSE